MNKRGEETSTEGWEMIIKTALIIIAALLLAGATFKIISVMTK